MKNLTLTTLLTSLLTSTVAAATLAVTSSAFTPAQAACLTSTGCMSFQINQKTGSTATGEITLTEVNGAIKFDIAAINTIADIRGVFFNIANDSLLSGLSVTGPNVTDSQFKAGLVNDLGNGANMNGGSSYKFFDAGVEIGTSGIGGGDDYRSTTFTLSHNSQSLSLTQFALQDFGLRFTSVGANRNGSSKLAGKSPNYSEPPKPVKVPEPGTVAALSLVGVAILSQKRKREVV